MLACCIYACQDRHKSTADIICGGSYRYWYEQDSPNYYHYFDVNGRKESFCITRKGIFKEVKMPDFEISTTWKALNESTIIISTAGLSRCVAVVPLSAHSQKPPVCDISALQQSCCKDTNKRVQYKTKTVFCFYCRAKVASTKSKLRMQRHTLHL